MAEQGRGAGVIPLPELRPVKPGTLLVRVPGSGDLGELSEADAARQPTLKEGG